MEGNEESLSAQLTAFYAILVVFLVLGAGLMSGLTLGLLSLDVLDLEVSSLLHCWHGQHPWHMRCGATEQQAGLLLSYEPKKAAD